MTSKRGWGSLGELPFVGNGLWCRVVSRRAPTSLGTLKFDLDAACRGIDKHELETNSYQFVDLEKSCNQHMKLHANCDNPNGFITIMTLELSASWHMNHTTLDT